MKRPEKAQHAGFCFVCGGPFYFRDLIYVGENNGMNIAAHKSCTESDWVAAMRILGEKAE